MIYFSKSTNTTCKNTLIIGYIKCYLIGFKYYYTIIYYYDIIITRTIM